MRVERPFRIVLITIKNMFMNEYSLINAPSKISAARPLLETN